MSNKDELLRQLDEGFSAFKATFAGLSDEQLGAVWLGEWSVKDILAHVSGWHREMTAGLQRLARGERPTPAGVDYSDPDPWNARFAAEARSLAPRDVLAKLDASFKDFRQSAADLSEDRFEPGRTVDRILHASGIDHYREHGEEIKAWRASVRVPHA